MLSWRERFVGARARFLVCSVLTAAGPITAYAQSAPEHILVDDNGIDLINKALKIEADDISIGPAAPDGLHNVRRGIDLPSTGQASLFGREFTGFVSIGSGSPVIITVTIGDTSERFSQSGALYTAMSGTGSTLTHPNSTTWIYTTFDGVEYTLFYDSITDPTFTLKGIRQVKYPSGQTITFTWVNKAFSVQPCTTRPCQTTTRQRLSSVTNSSGYQLKFSYSTNGTAATTPGPWITLTKIQAINNKIDACLPTADTCTGLTQAWPSATYSQALSGSTMTTTVVNDRGESWRYTGSSTSGTTAWGIRRPSAAADTTTATFSGDTVSVNREGIVTNYTFVDSGGVRTATATAPGSLQTIVISQINSGLVSSITDSAGKITSYLYDTAGRVSQVTQPEGNKVVFGYDSRSNVTSVTSKAKPNSGLADINIAASFPASCTNVFTCNQPTWTKDANGNQTDYTYDTEHGGILTVTRPADLGGIRPQTRHSYALTSGVWRLTEISECMTNATCAGTATEAKTAIGYDVNILPNLISRSSGDGSISSVTRRTYDYVGNVKTVDGALAGTSDTTAYRYGPGRRLSGVVLPDPDGFGARKPFAQKFTYNSDGQLALSESGYVDDASDTGWSAFSSQIQNVTVYDGNARPIETNLKSGSTVYAATQTSYDAVGRVDCSAQRMNPSVFDSLPSSACTLGASGSFGPDRITRYTYDANSRITKISRGYGTSSVFDDVTSTFSDNGLVSSRKDAENNLTIYEYDGFDRLLKTRFPVASKGASASSTTDYEQFSYDSASNLTQRRLRDGATISFTYDGLNRQVTITPSGEPVVNIAYDLLNHPLSLQRPADGMNYTLAWDALGRIARETQPFGSVAYQYDAAGNRTRITWPDAYYASYDFDYAGSITAVRENGAAGGVGVLASYNYDNLGRRTSVVRGNGTATYYGYDAVGRLKCLTQDLAGGSTIDCTPTAAGSDNATSFTYSPAGQISSSIRANEAYAWTAASNVNRDYTSNGLNQYTVAGTTTFGYDERGNLVASGTSTFGYSKLNQLTSALGVEMTYDPVGRLIQYATTGTTRMYYSEGDLIGEVTTSGTLLRRYVPGAGGDEPVVWYEGSGLTDRRFLHADERGSIVSISDSSGALLAMNRYDEFGIPQSGNVGRFGYTGQTWYAEAGLYNFKARWYSPTLGRFMQPDPIGYNDGLNWYNYVQSDPINFADPTGLRCYPAAAYRNFEGVQSSNRKVCFSDSTSGGSDSIGHGGGRGAGRGNQNSAPSPQRGNGCDTPYFKNLLGRKDVKDAIRQSIALGQSDKVPGIPGSTGVVRPGGGCCQSEYGFNFGYKFGGGRGAGAPFSDHEPRTINPGLPGSALSDGIYWRTDFFHYHPNGTDLDVDDIQQASYRGVNAIVFGPNGQVSCHAN